MKKRIIYKPDKTIVILIPATKSHGPDETEDEWLERVFTRMTQSNGLQGCDYKDVSSGDIPTKDKYRDAWRGEKDKAMIVDATIKAEIDARPVYTEAQEKQIQVEMRRMAAERLGL